MVFTTAAASGDTAEVFEVVQGSHVFSSEGDCFAEWDSLSAPQQAQLIGVQEYLGNAFLQARGMIASVGLKTSEPLTV